MPVMLTHQQKDEVIVEFSVTASAAAKTVFDGNIYQFGYNKSSVNPAIIPATEVWHLVSMRVNTTQANVQTDAQILYAQNGYDQDFKPFLTSLTSDNYTPYDFDESEPMYPTNNFSLSIVLTAAAPSTAYTQQLILRFVRAPYTG